VTATPLQTKLIMRHGTITTSATCLYQVAYSLLWSLLMTP